MKINSMRDTFLNTLYKAMKNDSNIFFISADFGSPILDKIRVEYPSRFINVGIAEQNLVNIATGLALEGFTVYIYAIAPFITMRCYEQIRVNIAILSQIRGMNVNIIGVGAGVSYAMSGPTHHCLEDISIMKTLPNIEIFSPSDYLTVERYVERTLKIKKPKYLRFDAKPVFSLQKSIDNINSGYRVLSEGKKFAIISTGYMTQKAFELLTEFDFKLIDIYILNNYDEEKLRNELKDIDNIITVEEGFKNAGGLDAEINSHFKNKKIFNIGFNKKYTFDVGSRDFIHKRNGIDLESIRHVIKEI